VRGFPKEQVHTTIMCVSYRQQCPYACIEGIWRTGYVAAVIRKLGTRWLWEVSCMPQPSKRAISSCLVRKGYTP